MLMFKNKVQNISERFLVQKYDTLELQSMHIIKKMSLLVIEDRYLAQASTLLWLQSYSRLFRGGFCFTFRHVISIFIGKLQWTEMQTTHKKRRSVKPDLSAPWTKQENLGGMGAYMIPPPTHLLARGFDHTVDTVEQL
jgi:hypothetical protein